MRKSVAIVGAGPAGLACLKALTGVVNRVVCYEKQSQLGGLWNYDWRTGNVHGSMYQGLWSNGPKECVEYADYSFLQHFGRPLPSYPPRAVILGNVVTRERL